MEENIIKEDKDNEFGQLLKDVALIFGFGWRSVKRHRLLIFTVFISVVVLSIAMIKIMPKTYESRARIVVNPSRTLIDVDQYTGRSSAVELMTSQESLSAVIDAVDLMNRWKKTRPAVSRFKDSILSALSSKKDPETEAQKLRMSLMYILGNKVQVWVADNILQVVVEWHDADTAYSITDVLVKRFMDDQFQRENAEYTVKISSFEKRLIVAEERLKVAEAEYRDTLSAEQAPRPKVSEPRSVREYVQPAPAAESSPEILPEVDLEAMERELELKTNEVVRMENSYLSRLKDAKDKLAELRLTIGPRHPEVIKAERLVSILSPPPPALKQLKAERDILAAQLEKQRKENKEASVASPRRRWRRVTGSTTTPQPAPSSSVDGAPSELELKFDEYQQAREERNSIAGELSYAKIEAQAGKSAFDFRFKISQPPRMPDGPIKPKPARILLAAIIAGLFLGIFLAILVDLRSGILFEKWQISRILRIPVLGEMDEP